MQSISLKEKPRTLAVRDSSSVFSSQCPVPVREMVCGALVALSVALKVVVAAPAAVGLKASESVQLAPAAREVMQVLPTISNSAALVPVKVKELTLIAVLPVLVKVMI